MTLAPGSRRHDERRPDSPRGDPLVDRGWHGARPCRLRPHAAAYRVQADRTRGGPAAAPPTTRPGAHVGASGSRADVSPAAAPKPAEAPAGCAKPTEAAKPAAAAPANVKRGGKLVFGLDVNPVGLDPAKTTAFASVQIYRAHVHRASGSLDYTTNKAIPDMAESWRNVDAKTSSTSCVPGVKFHGGREVTAEDVKYSIERVLDPATNAPLLSYYGPVARGQGSRQVPPSRS